MSTRGWLSKAWGSNRRVLPQADECARIRAVSSSARKSCDA